ncbi:hypothetical protein K525DRAFT_269587 [Schizophyllum commune Loenen D]|nr:hypothetical protein K525DRAFT_269587 [Schizophyllum commune Loenen D]
MRLPPRPIPNLTFIASYKSSTPENLATARTRVYELRDSVRSFDAMSGMSTSALAGYANNDDEAASKELEERAQRSREAFGDVYPRLQEITKKSTSLATSSYHFDLFWPYLLEGDDSTLRIGRFTGPSGYRVSLRMLARIPYPVSRGEQPRLHLAALRRILCAYCGSLCSSKIKSAHSTLLPPRIELRLRCP